ncbi:uncharacterized protein LOC131877894 [Tigriopus californicus]|uniref:uncharacterized protein LOC131877894 n=1 Tax=Tigriopus californicus TaxID=6832 RepID=UPI0027D9FA1A|nr:uncharacterized protein LOC131877894 [Tigriopus californicus]
MGILYRVKPFHNGLTVFLTDGSIPKKAWLELAVESNHAFFLAQMNGSAIGSISLICPFVKAHAADIEILWDESFGFYGDFIKTMMDQCFHQFQEVDWPVIYREIPPVVYNDTSSPDGVKGFEVDLANLLKKHLGIATPLVRDKATLIRLPNEPRIMSILYAMYSYEARLMIGSPPAHQDFNRFGDFSITIYTSTAHYCSRLPQPLPNYQNLIKVFPPNVWLVMLVTNLICSLVMYGMYRFYASHNVLTHLKIGSMKAKLLDFLIRINIGIMEPDAIPWFKTHSAGSLFSGTFYIYATFLGFFYTSMFLAALVSVERETPINNPRDALERGENVYMPNLLTMSNPALPNFKNLPTDVQEVGVMANRRGTVYDFFKAGYPAEGVKDMQENGASFVIGVVKTSSHSIVDNEWEEEYIRSGTDSIALAECFVCPEVRPVGSIHQPIDNAFGGFWSHILEPPKRGCL